MKKASASDGKPVSKPAPSTDNAPVESPLAKFKKPTRIAILGTATTSVGDAPYGDASWQIWNMSNNHWHKKRYDLWFELHDYDTLKAANTPPAYFEHLKSCGAKLVVGWPNAEHWPQASLFPLKMLLDAFEGDYYTCQCAYMIAYAVLLNEVSPGSVTEIGLWGVDMAIGEEYSHQKGCVEYWVGFARGKGIKVYIAPQSPCCRSNALYAFDNVKLSREFTERLKELQKAVAETKKESTQKARELLELEAAERVLRDMCNRWAL